MSPLVLNFVSSRLHLAVRRPWEKPDGKGYWKTSHILKAMKDRLVALNGRLRAAKSELSRSYFQGEIDALLFVMGIWETWC